MTDAAPPPERRAFPVLGWLRGYPAGWIGADLVAGVTIAAYAITVALAYATLAGLPMSEQAVICSTTARSWLCSAMC